jgi:hypothetical protein
LARFLALSLPLLCAIDLTFARFSTENKASDRDEVTRQAANGKVERGGASKICRIL